MEGLGHKAFHFGQECLRFVREGCSGELLPDVADRLRRGVDQVVGIETVVAQVVGEQFAGGEIVRVAEPFGQFADSNPQGSFAERIARRRRGGAPG